MKTALFLFSIYSLTLALFADAPARVWTLESASIIETTETEAVSSPVSDVTTQSRADDDSIERSVLDQKPDSVPEPETQTDGQILSMEAMEVADATPFTKQVLEQSFERRVDEVFSKIQATDRMQKKPPTDTVRQTEPVERRMPVSKASDKAAADEIETPDLRKNENGTTGEKEDDDITALFAEHTLLTAILIATLLVLGVLIAKVLLMKQKRSGMNAYFKDKHDYKSLLTETFGHYETLKGEMWRLLLTQKEEIYAQSAITEAEREKSVIEIEKRYTKMAFFDLPKLLSHDADRICEGIAVLVSDPNLKPIVTQFVTERMKEGKYTKVEKERILRTLERYGTQKRREPLQVPIVDRLQEEEISASLLE